MVALLGSSIAAGTVLIGLGIVVYGVVLWARRR